MSTRVLVVDDDEDGLSKMKESLLRGMLEHREELAGPEVQLIDTSAMEKAEDIAAAIEAVAREHWDALLVDVWLGQPDADELTKILLPLKLVKAFRGLNKTAVAFIYSGNIQDYLRKLYDLEKTRENKRPIESNLRTIVEAGVSEFLARNDAASVTVNRLLNPPWPLRIERQLLKTPSVSIEAGQLSDATPVSFAEIASAIRCGDHLGGRAAELIVNQGIAAIGDIFG